MSQRVWVVVRYATNVAVQGMIFKKESTPNQLKILQHFGFNPSVKLKVPKLVRWTPPQYGFSLNVDGTCKGNPGPCGSGGCIRDSNGDIHLGFAFYYGQGNNMLAEVHALCDGLRLAKYHGLPISIVNYDSLALVHSINSNMCPSWKCTWWWRIARSFLSKTNIKLVHVYRETNRVANALAPYACDRGGISVFHSRSSLPSKYEYDRNRKYDDGEQRRATRLGNSNSRFIRASRSLTCSNRVYDIVRCNIMYQEWRLSRIFVFLYIAKGGIRYPAL
ncbi:hypothetical protein Taro_011457 [Colocasia esculenta]|uniref:RNase H type-1 domain-containing protein n=1 Tax=Colocasia esculenta TaxID=4460 RepID=A0A843UA89_COLES|nr:hypothetical protein [Colocasia esculenta]